MSKIIHPRCWRLDDAGKLRFDVPIMLGMRVFEMWRRGPITSFVVATIIFDDDQSCWIGTAGGGGSEGQYLFLTERAAEVAKAMRRPPKPLQVKADLLPHELAAALLSHPTCRLRGRRRVSVPIAIGMEVFVHRAGKKTVGPLYVEAVTDDDVMCCNVKPGAGPDDVIEIHAKPSEVFATGKAERPTEITNAE